MDLFSPLPAGWYYDPRCYCAFVVCKCNFLPSCDDRYIFYKDIHICMWVSVSMLNPQVLLCEPTPHPLLCSRRRYSAHFRGFLFLFGFHCWFRVAVTSCVLPVISTCFDCWLVIDPLPRNAATVSSSNTELKIIELGLKDSEEKLYQPPDSGGKDFFLSFQHFNHLRCARDFHACVKKTKTDHFNSTVFYYFYFILKYMQVCFTWVWFTVYMGFVSFNELWDTTKKFFPIPNRPIIINITLNLRDVWCAFEFWLLLTIVFIRERNFVKLSQ